jgi:L-glyceraldehyde 3-phosphate reductase
VRALNEIARARGQTLAQMALAWALRDRWVTSWSARAANEQLEENLAAVGGPPLRADELWAKSSES